MTTPLSRRDFFLAALAASALPAVAAPADAGFRFGVQSYTFRKFKRLEAFKLAKEVGVAEIELYRGHLAVTATPEQIKEAVTEAKDNGLTIASFGVERFTKDHEANKKLFAFGQAVGITSFSADPDPDSFDSLDKLVAETKIAIGIHPHGPSGKGKHRWYSAEIMLKAVKDHHPLIGSCIDTGHMIRMAQLNEPLDVIAQTKIMGDRNKMFHLKDHDNKRKTDVVFGKDGGVLDVSALLKLLKEMKFTGPLSIEFEASPDNPTADVKTCVAVIRDAATRLG